MAWLYRFRWLIVCAYIMISNPDRVEAIAVATMEEVCLMETFNAQCPDDSVIVVQSALYGRMRPSECDPLDKGNLGCVADVLHHMDERCSGRRECSLIVPGDGLSQLNVCPRGHFPYLEITYTCLPVISSHTYEDACQTKGAMILNGYTEGVIASSVVYSSGVGSQPCPFIIEAEQGQRINVTLVDFSHGQSTDPEMGVGATCHRYAMVSERPSGVPRMVCRGMQRERSVYMSDSHQLEIQLSSRDGFDFSSNFLLEFSVVGCTDPDLRGNELTERSPNRAILYCHNTGKTTQLTCHGSHWNDMAEDCDAKIGGVAKRWSSLEGLVITLVVGIFIGAIIAAIVMCCFWLCIRRRFKKKQPRQIVYYDVNAQWNAGKPLNTWDPHFDTRRSVDYDGRSRRSTRDYEPVYDQIQQDLKMDDDLPMRYDTLNRNIFHELPFPPAPLTTDAGSDSYTAYAKPV